MGVIIVVHIRSHMIIHPTYNPIGNTEVIWTITDGYGNQNTCHQMIEVRDSIIPVTSLRIKFQIQLIMPMLSYLFLYHNPSSTTIAQSLIRILTTTRQTPVTCIQSENMKLYGLWWMRRAMKPLALQQWKSFLPMRHLLFVRRTPLFIRPPQHVMQKWKCWYLCPISAIRSMISIPLQTQREFILRESNT